MHVPVFVPHSINVSSTSSPVLPFTMPYAIRLQQRISELRIVTLFARISTQPLILRFAITAPGVVTVMLPVDSVSGPVGPVFEASG